MSKENDPGPLDFSVSTHTGHVMQENQDFFTDFECINGHVFIVCDGMGNHDAGVVASRLAVENIRAYLENHYFDMPEDGLKAAIEFANSVVYKRSKQKPEYQGMGTTIVMAMVRQGKMYYAHVGDSRIYIFSDGRLHRLTRDHSRVQDLVDHGVLTNDEARKHPDRKEVTRALGTSANIEIELCLSPAIPAVNDLILMCTDGLFFMLDDAEIADSIAGSLTVQEKADNLINRANEKGGIDNSTVQLICFANVPNKRAKFASISNLPKEMKSAITKNEQSDVEPIIGYKTEQEKPVDEEFASEELVSEELANTELDAEEPVAEEPLTGEPVIEEPVTEEPVTEEPVTEELVIEELVSEELLTEELVSEASVNEELASEDTVNEEEQLAESADETEPLVSQPVQENGPIIHKLEIDDEPVVDEIDKNVEPFVTETSKEAWPFVNEPYKAAEPEINEPVREKIIPKNVFAKENETAENEEKSSFFDRFGFYKKLKEKPETLRRIRIVAGIIGVLFVAYVFWDIFIKQSAPTQVTEDKKNNKEVLGQQPIDTVATQVQAPVAPDTVWISYSVKKGEYLGTIASKFGVTVEYIKRKNKLSNDNIREQQKLQIPTKANHTVKPGESITTIAQKYALDKKSVMRVNGIQDEKNIKVGKSLIIPFK